MRSEPINLDNRCPEKSLYSLAFNNNNMKAFSGQLHPAHRIRPTLIRTLLLTFLRGRPLRQPSLNVLQSLRLYILHRRVVNPILRDKIRAVESVALDDWLQGCAGDVQAVS